MPRIHSPKLPGHAAGQRRVQRDVPAAEHGLGEGLVEVVRVALAGQVGEDEGLVDEDAEGALGVQGVTGGDEVVIDGRGADRRARERVGHDFLLDLGDELVGVGGDGGVSVVVGVEEAHDDGGAGEGCDGGWRGGSGKVSRK